MLKFLKFFMLPFMALVTFAIACNKADDAVTVDNAVDQALYSVQERGGIGKYGCYELVFPVSITLPDSSVVEVNSYDEMKEALRAYFQANGTGGGSGHPHGGNGNNPGPRPHPEFVFPISVIDQDGAVITVEDEAALRALREACAGTFVNHTPFGHGQHGLSCFEIVFPITIQFPDGTTAEATDRQSMRQLIRTWRQNNPGVSDRPQIVFPITVKMTDDGALITVNSSDELKALKEGCE